MKKIISAVLILVTVMSAVWSLGSCQFEKEYDGKEIASIEYRGGRGYTRNINFSNGEVMESFKSPVDSTDAYDARLVCTISDDDLKLLTNKFYNAGLFDLDNEYIPNGTVYDGYNWWLTISYADGSEKKSAGYSEQPTEIFREANLEYFSITGLDFCGYVNEKYKKPPQIYVEYGDGSNNKAIGFEAYEYVWVNQHVKKSTFTDKTLLAGNKLTINSGDGKKVALIKVDDESSKYFTTTPPKEFYKYSSATVTSYNADGSDEQLITTSKRNKTIEIELVSGRIYVVEMDLVYGDAKYAFYYE